MYPDDEHQRDHEGWFPSVPEQPEPQAPYPHRDDRLINSAFLAIVHCRGVIVGDDNTQINTTVFHIEQPTVNLSSILESERVRTALYELGRADPESFDAAQKRAEHELAAGPWRLLGHSLIDLSQSEPRTKRCLRSLFSALGGAVLIEDCQGVQVGDHDSQYNHFQFVCPAAPIDAVELLAGNYALAHALVERVVSGGGSGAIDRALNDTLMQSADVQQLAEPTNLSTGYRYGEIVNRDAVAVGRGNRVRSTVSVHTTVDGTRNSILRDLKSLQRDVSDARTQKAHWQAEQRELAAEVSRPADGPQLSNAPSQPMNAADADRHVGGVVEEIINGLRDEPTWSPYLPSPLDEPTQPGRTPDEIVEDLIKRYRADKRGIEPDERDERGWGGGGFDRF